MVNKTKMLEDIFHESRTNILLGGKGSGKSNFTSCLMRDLVPLGYDNWTNIHFFEMDEVPKACNRGKLPKGVKYVQVPSQIHVVAKLSELLYGLLKPGPKAVFLDEAGIVSPSGTSKDTKNIKQLAYVIRHFDCALTLVTQVAGSVPPDLREKLVDYRLKIYKKGNRRDLDIGERTVSIDDEGNDFIDFPVIKKFEGLPMSTLPYDGDFPSSFEIDIDLKQALDAFGKCKSSLEVEKRGAEILDDLLESKKSVRPLKEQIAEFKARNPKMGRQEIAKIFKTSANYVSQC